MVSDLSLGLLVGGLGCRMEMGAQGPLGKAVLRLGDRRLVEFILESAHEAGVRSVVAALRAGDGGATIAQIRDPRFSWRTLEQVQPGTAGAVKAIMSELREVDHLVSVSDVVCSARVIPDLIECSRSGSPRIVVAVTDVETASSPVNVSVADSGEVMRLGKGLAGTGLTYGGVRWVSGDVSIADYFGTLDTARDSDLLGAFVQKNPGCVVSCYIPHMFDIDTPEDLRDAWAWQRSSEGK